jgi:hypothetical protein
MKRKKMLTQLKYSKETYSLDIHLFPTRESGWKLILDTIYRNFDLSLHIYINICCQIRGAFCIFTEKSTRRNQS